MGADGGGLLEHRDRDLGKRLPLGARHDVTVVALDQVGEMDRTREAGGSGPDELDVELEELAFHPESQRPCAAGVVLLGGCAAPESCACFSASSQRSASIAAMQPEPAAVTAWR